MFMLVHLRVVPVVDFVLSGLARQYCSLVELVTSSDINAVAASSKIYLGLKSLFEGASSAGGQEAMVPSYDNKHQPPRL